MKQYRFLPYASQDSAGVAAELGRAEYSYWFVQQYFLPLLAELGQVQLLTRADDAVPPDTEVTDVRLLFLPPQLVPESVADPSIPVFAWEYSTIPTEPFAGDPRNDWRTVLGRTPGAITHSRYAAAAVRETMGGSYPVAALPAPVWDRFADLADGDAPQIATIEFDGSVLDSATVDPANGPTMPQVASGHWRLEVDGVVYTTVVNPHDGRKVWQDTITAFVWAHRDNPDATLVVKLVHHDRDIALTAAWDFIHRLAPYRCRIVALHAFLPDETYRQLIQASTFVVNSSRGEGQCLPLMEFMSAGVPAIAPDHTAMAEYVTAENAFVVTWSREWTWWPHDPRRFLRCMTHPVDWDSLRQAFVASYVLATQDPGRYRQMSATATSTLQRHCAQQVVAAALREFLGTLPLPSRSA